MAPARPTPQEIDAQLPAARASVLARLWGAFAREPIGHDRPAVNGGFQPSGCPTASSPGAAVRDGGHLVVRVGRHDLRGDAGTAEPFARAVAGFALELDGRPCTDPGSLVRGLLAGAEASRFADELDNSVHNLALARAAQPVPDGGPPLLDRLVRLAPSAALAAAEQAVVDGHPLHPGCRTRMGMTTDDVRAYAPEHRPVVELIRIAAPPGRWLTTGRGADHLLLHPWQFRRWADELRLTPIGDTVPARPLMSLRTLAPLDGPPVHIKTAVDIQMTSAVRQVSPAAVHNGPLLSGLLAPLGRRCGLTVLTELAGAAVTGEDGQPDRRLAMLIRSAPQPRHGEVILPIAALSAPSPATGRPILAEAVGTGDPLAFLAGVVTTVIPPLLRMLHAGVALEAHGQNTLLGLRAGRPTQLLYRDLGGVRISGQRLAVAGWPEPALAGDLPTDDPEVLRTKLFAAVVGTVLPELVDTVVRTWSVEPDRAWAAVAAAIGQQPPSPDLAALCTQPVPVKATTAMRLAGDPLADKWCTVDNPLARFA